MNFSAAVRGRLAGLGLRTCAVIATFVSVTKRAAIKKPRRRTGSRTAGRGEWQLHAAKDRLSEVVRRAGSEGAQTISLHGRPTAVVISYEDYRKMRGREQSFTEFLRSLPMAGMGLEIENAIFSPDGRRGTEMWDSNK